MDRVHAQAYYLVKPGFRYWFDREETASRHRTRLLDSLNGSTLDDVGPVGGDQDRAVLYEMNELGELQEQIIRDGVPKLSVL